MRLSILEGNESYEYPDTSSHTLYEKYVTNMVEKIKKECKPFINEFHRNGYRVYRGMDSFSENSVHEVETREKRETSFGPTMSNDVFRNQFNDYMEQKGVTRRDKHVAYTTTTEPKSFTGVSVNYWFYFIPIGHYSYSYIKGVTQDINISDNNYFMEQVEKLNGIYENITDIELVLSQYSNVLIENIDEMSETLDNVKNQYKSYTDNPSRFEEASNHVISTLSKIKHKYEELIVKNFYKNIFEDLTIEFLIKNKSLLTGSFETLLEEVNNILILNSDYFKPTFKIISENIERLEKESNIKVGELSKLFENLNTITGIIGELLYQRSLIDSTIKLISENGWKIEETIGDINNNVITNNIDSECIVNNELWFETKKYILVPYNEVGDDIIKKL